MLTNAVFSELAINASVLNISWSLKNGFCSPAYLIRIQRIYKDGKSVPNRFALHPAIRQESSNVIEQAPSK